MTYGELSLHSTVALPTTALDDLIAHLREAGYQVHAPQVREGVLRYGPIQSAADLPQGWVAHQAPGHYRLERNGSSRRFALPPGPDTWKRYLFPPREVLFT